MSTEPSKTLPWPRPHHLILALAVLIFAWRVFDYFTPVYFGIADEHGYVTTAKRLAITGRFVLRQPDPYAFVGETMMQSPMNAEIYYLRQPIGYPFLCAMLYAVNGQPGPFFVNPLCGLALLLGVWVLGKQLQNPLAGALAALVLAAHPVMLNYTIKPLSHVPDMAVGVWAIVAALAWRREQRWSDALLAGVALGAGILIRYTNVLLVLPLAVVLWESRKKVPADKLMLQVAAGAGIVALAVVALLSYHTAAFGHMFQTGYAAGGNDKSFSLAYLLDHAPAMLKCLWLPATGLTVLSLLVIVGAVVLAMRNRFMLALLLAWALPLLVLNTSYYGMPRNNLLLYARFALASYVPLLLIALGWTAYAGNSRRRFEIAASLLVLVAIVWNNADPVMMSRGKNVAQDPINATWNDMGQLELTRNMALLVSVQADLAAKKAPPGSVILADNHTAYFMEYVDAYTIYSPDSFDVQKVKKRIADLDQYPREFDPQRTRQIRDLLGNRTQVELDNLLRQRFEAYLAIGRPVYVLAKEQQVEGGGGEESKGWKQRLGMPMRRVAGEGLPVGLWQLGVE